MFELQGIEAAMVDHRHAMMLAEAQATHLPARRSRWRQATAALRKRTASLVPPRAETERSTQVRGALAAGPVG